MTVIYFDAETREAFREIAELVDILGIKPIEELSNTEIVDKDGVVHDLSELIKTNCVIDNGCGVIFMGIRADCVGPMAGLFVSSAGKHFSSEALANLIREHEDDDDFLITVHKF